MRSFILLFFLVMSAGIAKGELTFSDPNGNDFNVTLADGQSVQMEIDIASDDVLDEIESTVFYGGGVTVENSCVQEFTEGNETCTAVLSIDGNTRGTKSLRFRYNGGSATNARPSWERVSFTVNRINSGNPINPSNYENAFNTIPSGNIDLGTVSTSVTQTIYIQNITGSPSDILAPIVMNTPGFSILSDYCSGRIVGAFNNCRLLVEFSADPLFSGTYQQTVNIHPEVDNSSPFSFSISAYVEEPPRAKTEVLAGFTKVDPTACLALSPSDPSLCYYESDGVQASTEVGSVYCHEGDCAVAITKRLANEPVEFVIGVTFPDSTITGQSPEDFDFSLSPEVDNAGQVLLGQKITRTIVLTNLGPASLPIPIAVSPTVSGGVASVIVNNGCSSKAAAITVGDTCSISVEITPILQGTTTVNLEVSSIIGTTQSATITTTTDSTGLNFTATPASLSLGVNSNDTAQITVTNNSSINQPISRPLVVSLSGTGLTVNPTNSSCLNVSTGLTQNSSCTIEVVNTVGINSQFPQIASISSSGVSKNVSIDANTILHTLTLNLTKNVNASEAESVEVYKTTPLTLLTVCTTATCSLTLEENTGITITPQGASNSQTTFNGGACSGINTPSCAITMDSSKTVNVEMLELQQLTLTPDSPSDINSGQSVQFTASGGLPDYTYTIVGGSSIGSTVNSSGLYLAGTNATGSTVMETVKVSDSNGNEETETISILYTVPEYQLTVNFTPYTLGGNGYYPDQVAVGSPELESQSGPACTSGSCVYTITGGEQAVLHVIAGTNGGYAKSKISSWGGDCSAVPASENICIIGNIQEDKTVNISMEYIQGPAVITPNPVADLNFGDTINFDVSSGATVSLVFEIVGGSSIGSTITEGSLYTAGNNQTGLPVVETVRVTDDEGSTDEVSFNVLPVLGGTSFTLSSSSLSFGQTFQSQQKDFTIQVVNDGTSEINLPLTLTRTSGSTKFSGKNTGCLASGSLDEGDSCLLTLTHSADLNLTTDSANFDITGSDGTTSQTSTLSASAQTIESGEFEIALNTSSPIFTGKTGGQQSTLATARVVVSNVGTKSIDGSSISLSPNSSNGGQFNIATPEIETDSGDDGLFPCRHYGGLPTGVQCYVVISYDITGYSGSYPVSYSVAGTLSATGTGGGGSASATLSLVLDYERSVFKVRPESITIPTDEKMRLSLSGGVGPYTINFSGIGVNTAVQTESNDSGSSNGYTHDVDYLTYTSIQEGTATIEITDSTGAIATSNITVENSFGIGGFAFDPKVGQAAAMIVRGNGAGPADDEIFLAPSLDRTVLNQRTGVTKILGNGKLDTSFGILGRSEDLHAQTVSNTNCEYTLFGVPPFCPSDIYMVSDRFLTEGSGSDLFLTRGFREALGQDQDILLKKYSNGSLAASFGSSGELILEHPEASETYHESPNDIAFKGGQIYISKNIGQAGINNDDAIGILSINSITGAMNSSFTGIDGYPGRSYFFPDASVNYFTEVDNGENSVGTPGSETGYNILFTSDNKILLPGRSKNAVYEVNGTDKIYSSNFFLKINQDGSLDTSFGNSGRIDEDYSPYGAFGGHVYSGSKFVGNEDYYYAVGYRQNVSPPQIVYFNEDQFREKVLRRYNISDGTLDLSYGVSGEVVLTDDIEETRLELQPDGKIISATLKNGSIVLTRLGSDGYPDNSFGVSGVKEIKLASDYVSLGPIKATSENIYLAMSYSLFDKQIQDTLSGLGSEAPAHFDLKKSNLRAAGVLRLNIDGTVDGDFDNLIKMGYSCSSRGDWNTNTQSCDCDPGFVEDTNYFSKGMCVDMKTFCEDNSGEWTGEACVCQDSTWDPAQGCMGGQEFGQMRNECLYTGGNYINEECQCEGSLIPINDNGYDVCTEDERVGQCVEAGGTWNSGAEDCEGLPFRDIAIDEVECGMALDNYSCEDCFQNQSGQAWDNDNNVCISGCSDAQDFISCQGYNSGGLNCFWDDQGQSCM